MARQPELDIRAVQRILPHRFPMLLVDRVIEIDGDRRAVGIKNVSINEPFFQGHYPRYPIMPGVLIIEALAQAAGILAFQTAGVIPDEHTRFFFVGIDGARFRKPVEPGDQLILRAVFVRAMRGIWKFSTLAEVDGREVCCAEMMVTPEARA
jgi:3-hydroxyacyl-[acyl-carrier-protein] dehydratase